MISINNKKVLLLLLVASLIIVSSCAKAECKTSSDCLSKQCTLSKCENKKCVYTLGRDCCGNGVKDSVEDGKPGTQCTCPADYGKCEGKGKVKIGSRVEDAAYVHYYCGRDGRCTLGVESKDISPQNFLDAISLGYFKASSVVRYNKPFDVSKDFFELKITLDDASKDLVFPIKITNIKLLFSGDSRTELLIAEENLDTSISNVGDTVAINAPLNLDYKPQEAEEAGSARYTLDYTYTKRIPDGRAPDGTTIYTQELAREKFNSPSKQVFFVKSG